MTGKKLEKIEKVLGKEVTGEMQALTPDGIKSLIVQAETSIKQAVDELEANDKYQELKESLKALTSGLKDVRKFQNAKIQYALFLLEDKGE